MESYIVGLGISAVAFPYRFPESQVGKALRELLAKFGGTCIKGKPALHFLTVLRIRTQASPFS